MPAALPVFIKRGDARTEVDRLLARLGPEPEGAGFRKYFYAVQTNQTVVMVGDRDAPLAAALRDAGGWMEPVE